MLCLALLPLLGYRLLFALAALYSLAGVLLILFSIRETRTSEGRIFKGLSLRDIVPNLRLYMFLSALFALAAFSYSFLLIYAKRSGFRMAFIPLLYLIFTATASLLSLPFGRLEKGAAADLVVCDYRTPTPLTPESLAGHLLFGLDRSHVRSVMVAGRWVLRDRRVTTIDEKVVFARARGVATALWERMARL